MSDESDSRSAPTDERVPSRIDSPDGPASHATVTPDPAGFLRVRVVGRLTPAFAGRIRRAVAEAHPGRDRLVDLRAADLGAWDAAAIRAFHADTAGERPHAPPSRVAALVSRDLDYGISRMFEGLAPVRLPVTYRTFRDEQEAVAWLTAPPAADEDAGE